MKGFIRFGALFFCTLVEGIRYLPVKRRSHRPAPLTWHVSSEISQEVFEGQTPYKLINNGQRCGNVSYGCGNTPYKFLRPEIYPAGGNRASNLVNGAYLPGPGRGPLKNGFLGLKGLVSTGLGIILRKRLGQDRP